MFSNVNHTKPRITAQYLWTGWVFLVMLCVCGSSPPHTKPSSFTIWLMFCFCSLSTCSISTVCLEIKANISPLQRKIGRGRFAREKQQPGGGVYLTLALPVTPPAPQLPPSTVCSFACAINTAPEPGSGGKEATGEDGFMGKMSSTFLPCRSPPPDAALQRRRGTWDFRIHALGPA